MSIPVLVTLTGESAGFMAALGAASSGILSLGEAAEANAAKMAAIKDAMWQLDAATDSSKIAAFETELAKLGDAADANAAKVDGLKTALSVGLVAGLGAVAVKSAEMATDFDDKMTLLQTSAGLAEGSVKQFGDSLKTISEETGVSLDDLAEGSYKALSQLQAIGYTSQQVSGVMHASAELAKIDNSNVTVTTQALSTAMRDYGASADQAVSYANGFRAAVGDSNTTIGDFSGNIGKLLNTAHSLNIGFDQAAGALATLTSEGMDASSANTLLSSTMLHLADQTPAATKEWDALSKQLGDTSLSAQNFEKTLQTQGLTGAMSMLTGAIKRAAGPDGFIALQQAIDNTKKKGTDFQTEFDHLPPKLQSSVAAIANISGGVKGMGVVLGLTGSNLTAFEKAVDDVNKGMKDAGPDVDTWAKKQQSAKQQMDELKTTIGVVAVDLGTSLLPAINHVVDATKDIIQWFQAHKVAADALGVVIGVLAAGAMMNFVGKAGSFAMAGIKMVLSLVGIGAAAEEGAVGVGIFEAVFSPVGIGIMVVVAVIAVLVFAIYELVTHWKTVWNAIKSVTEAVWHAITSVISGAWHAIVSFFSSAAHTIAAPIEAAWNGIKHVTETVWNAISGFFKKWWPLLFALFAFPIFLITGLIRRNWDTIKSVTEVVWNAIKGFLEAVWNGIVAVAQTVWNLLIDYVVHPVMAVWNFLVSIWNAVVSFLAGIWDSITSAVSTAWNAVWNLIVRIGESIWNAIKSPFEKALSFVRGLIGDFLNLGRDIVMGVVHGVENAASALIDKLVSLAKEALHAAMSFLGIHSPSKVFADEVGHWIPHGIAAGIDSQAHVVDAALRRVTDPKKFALTTPFGTASISAGGGGGSAQGQVVVNINGPYYGMGGAQAAAKDIRTELLKLQVRTPLGFN